MRSLGILLRVPFVICFAVGAAGGQGASPGLALRPVRSVMLQKLSGQVDQAIPLPGGGYAVRDSNFRRPESQTIEVYDHSGAMVRKIGGFGNGPPDFMRLMSVAAVEGGDIWSADFVRRINRYAPSGKLAGTLLLQNPPLATLTSLAVDEPRGLFYVAGCVPQHVYVDTGCLLVHQYSLKDYKFVRSFLPTDPALIKGNLGPFEATLLDVDRSGDIWAVDLPLFKLFRVQPLASKVESFPVHSRMARPTLFLPLPQPGKKVDNVTPFDSAFLLWRVLAAGPYVAVSIRKPHESGYLLQVFDKKGAQVGVDLASPGQLVGRTSDGLLIFCVPKPPQGFELTEYRISAKENGATARAHAR